MEGGMSSRTPTITTPDGRQVTVARIHPARYSDAHVGLFRQLLEHEAALLARPVRCIDSMCGAGGIHRCASEMVETVGNEIELPWVQVARQLFPDRQTVQGDAAALAFPDNSFDVAIVSCDFGNRLADNHNAKDPCSCRKVRDAAGTVLEVLPVDHPDVARCSKCNGVGLSLRRSYAADLRRLTGDPSYQLTTGSSAGTYAWQQTYWRNQVRYWQEVLRVLRPGGLFGLDVKDVVRTVKGQARTIPVVDGHRRILTTLGFEVQADVPLAADGLRYGDNRELRVDGHTILMARKAAAAGEVAA